MPRPLVGIVICYLIGLVLGEALTFYPLTATGCTAVALGLGYVFDGRHGKVIPFVLAAAMVFLGAARIQIAERVDPARDLSRFAGRDPVTLIGVIEEPLQHGPESTLLFLKARSVIQRGSTYPASGIVRLTVRDFVPDFQYGDRVSAELRLRPISGLRNPGTFDYSAYLQREGIRASAGIHRSEQITRLASGGFVPLRRIYAWRERIRNVLDGSLSPVASSILQAMLIGETGSLNPEIREAFMISGTTHLLSISGSHLALVAMVVFRLSGRILTRMPARWLLSSSRRLTVTRLSVLITFFPVVFYALLAGAQVATVRSLIMILIYLAAVWFQRADDPLNALAVAALLSVLWDPQAIFSISFQLSYIAVLAMVLAAADEIPFREVGDEAAREPGRETSWMGRWLKMIQVYLWMTLVAESATLPLTAFYFNQVSWVGFFSNLIVVPFVGMVTVPLGLACSVGAILFDRTTLPLSGLNEALADLLYSMVQWFARFPASEVHVPSPPVLVLVVIYLAGVVVLVCRANRAWRWTATGLCVLITTVWIVRLLEFHSDGRLRVTFLDVGQGDAAWIEMPDGKTMLIDGGGRYGNYDLGRLAVAPYLWNTGHWRIDRLVASHPQLDHMGGLAYMARKFRIGELWTNGLEKDAVFYDRFREIVQARAIPERRITGDGSPLLQGPVRVVPLHPKIADSNGPENDQSLVIRLEYGREAILFTGDIERPAERELLRWGTLLKATVLKVPHHGSRTSIDPDFLAELTPDIAVISVGENNPYRHPSVETLSAYRALKTKVYRTDRDGAVMIEMDGNRRKVITFQDGVLQPVSWGRGMTTAEASNFAKIFHAYWSGPS
ncbi:MAG TPA: DNA internalization-related competence protein ComEC/Rec2 [Nitrospiria bacterium]|nr:DNA internalization-related competence protein ComEC/Rec2 [Nitrospiria bacterium]